MDNQEIQFSLSLCFSLSPSASFSLPLLLSLTKRNCMKKSSREKLKEETFQRTRKGTNFSLFHDHHLKNPMKGSSSFFFSLSSSFFLFLSLSVYPLFEKCLLIKQVSLLFHFFFSRKIFGPLPGFLFQFSLSLKGIFFHLPSSRFLDFLPPQDSKVV